jgi:hypothetical protein
LQQTQLGALIEKPVVGAMPLRQVGEVQLAESLEFLLGSRYCETDHLSDTAWSFFGRVPPGWTRVQAICDYMHDRLCFSYADARSTRTAWMGIRKGSAFATNLPTYRLPCAAA